MGMCRTPRIRLRGARKVIPRLVQGGIYQNWYKSRHDRGRRPSGPGPTPQGARGGDVLDVQDPAPGQGWKVIPRLIQGGIYQSWYKAAGPGDVPGSRHTGSGDVQWAPVRGIPWLYQSWYNFSQPRKPRRSAVHVPSQPRRGRAGRPGSDTREGPESYTRVGTRRAGYTRIGTNHVLQGGRAGLPGSGTRGGRKIIPRLVQVQAFGTFGRAPDPSRHVSGGRSRLSCQHPEARTHPAYPLGQVRLPRLEHL